MKHDYAPRTMPLTLRGWINYLLPSRGAATSCNVHRVLTAMDLPDGHNLRGLRCECPAVSVAEIRAMAGGR